MSGSIVPAACSLFLTAESGDLPCSCFDITPSKQDSGFQQEKRGLNHHF
jgi:hypothetical protein